MTALQSVNQGTAPAGSDGDTVRSAFTKMNSNVAVLNAQAALTSIYLAAAQTLTAAHVGKRVSFGITAASTAQMPKAADAGADGIVCVRNVGSALLTLAPTTGSNDTLAYTKVNPGESILFDSDGANRWNVLMRGRTNADNEIVNGTLTVGGALAVAAGVVGNLAATGKVNGVNSPNLIRNGSGELGNSLWSTSYFSAQTDVTNAQGNYFLSTVAETSGTAQYDWNELLAVAASTPVVLQGEIYNKGQTAGDTRLGIDWLNSSGGIVRTDYFSVPLGSDWTQNWIAVVAPTGSVNARVFRGIFGAVKASSGGVGFRRIKLERGISPSLYSNEITLNYMAGLFRANNDGAAYQTIYPRNIEMGHRNTDPIPTDPCYIDFHTNSAGYYDYDARIIVGSTNAAYAGGANLTMVAGGGVFIASNPTASNYSTPIWWQSSGFQMAVRTNASIPGMEFLNNGSSVAAVLRNDGTWVPGGPVESGTGYRCKGGSAGGISSNVFNIQWTGTAQLWIDTSNQGTFTLTCDERVKKNIIDLPEIGFTERLMQMRVIDFAFKDIGIYRDTGQTYQGVSAQNLYSINPKFVQGTPDEMTTYQPRDDEGNQLEGPPIQVPQPMHPDSIALISELIGGFKELNTVIRDLRDRVASLEAAR